MHIRYLLFNAYASGGTARTVIHQANALAAEHDVEVASVYRHRDAPHLTVDPRVTLRPLTELRSDGRYRTDPDRARVLARARVLPSPGPHVLDARFRRWDPTVDAAIVRYMRAARDGVLVTTRPGLNLLSAMFGRRSVARVAQEHSNWASRPPALRRTAGMLYPRLDAVVTLTERDAQDYRSALAGSGVHVETVPNGVPASDCPPAALEAPVIVSAGRLVRSKGFDLLLEAFARLADRHPDWQLQIYGGGDQRADLLQCIERLGLAGRARLMGVSRDLDRRLPEASVFALSSRYEGFPMVLLEAMSAGLPVVSFDCPTGPAEVLTDGVDGLLVTAEDVGALAAALEALVTDPARRRAIGAAALQTAARYRVEAVAETWQQLFSDLLAAKSDS